MTLRRLFDSSALAPGVSVRFDLPPVRGPFGPVRFEGFVYRLKSGGARAWLNVCPHRAQAVDVGDGRLFLPGGIIECHAHGARFDPSSGDCVDGPCEGRGLTPLNVIEQGGALWLDEQNPYPADDRE